MKLDQILNGTASPAVAPVTAGTVSSSDSILPAYIKTVDTILKLTTGAGCWVTGLSKVKENFNVVPAGILVKIGMASTRVPEA